jgi:hypothetical protein
MEQILATLARPEQARLSCLSLTNIVAGSYNNVIEGARLVYGRRMSSET